MKRKRARVENLRESQGECASTGNNLSKQACFRANFIKQATGSSNIGKSHLSIGQVLIKNNLHFFQEKKMISGD